MPPNRFESEVESFLEGSHGDRTHIKRADHHTVTPLCGTLLLCSPLSAVSSAFLARRGDVGFIQPPTSARKGATGFIAIASVAPERDIVRPARHGYTPERDIIRPARSKQPKMSVVWRAGRIFSRKYHRRGSVGRTLSRLKREPTC